MPLEVLVTGSRGAIGRVTTTALRARGHRIRGVDRRPSEHADDVVADLQDRAAIDLAMRGVAAVVHLGATPDRADFVADLVPNNVIGSWQIYDSAVAAGATRMIYASSCRTVHGRSWKGMLRADDALAPADEYGLTKEFGERMGAYFARRHGLAVIAMRIGWLVRTADEKAHVGKRGSDLYLSWDDCARFVVAAVEGVWSGFHALFAVGPAGAARYDLEPARALLGWQPRDHWPEGTPL